MNKNVKTFILRKKILEALESLISIITLTFSLKRFSTVIARICPRFLVSCYKGKIILLMELIKTAVNRLQ
jgi:hypothetical protein